MPQQLVDAIVPGWIFHTPPPQKQSNKEVSTKIVLKHQLTYLKIVFITIFNYYSLLTTHYEPSTIVSPGKKEAKNSSLEPQLHAKELGSLGFFWALQTRQQIGHLACDLDRWTLAAAETVEVFPESGYI